MEPPSANSVAANFNSGDQSVESKLNSEIGRCQNPSEERLPEVEEQKLTTGELLEDMAEHQDIVECIQEEGESVKSWLKRAVRGAHAHGWNSKKTTMDNRAKESPRSDDLGTTVIKVVPPLVEYSTFVKTCPFYTLYISQFQHMLNKSEFSIFHYEKIMRVSPGKI